MPAIPSDTTNFPSAASNSSNQNEPQKATAQDHLSKGPQIPDNMPPKASREEIEARKKELNK
ncbi:hypothetical protein F9C07_8818 [Aspergillus flavus]|uniref:Uncharacterized protein n=2 Tax=Aspergillus flavus TaxID=5059 RepID=A0A7U2MIV9_ASPFN|nr:hypothetical protein AFLA_009355 [Aspergillus flavus NRRL3357]KAJ1706906.1 hypothetical protein NYO67_10939 [Aspergillus flavus]KOC08296.1 hypothetical protein AFLA70_234g001851 [Aspergillus flavus AF70]QRD84563.1 hypothetical protein F9C07_8818 [Aspergillus flavus]RAQ48399.1 hypothetical protein AFGD_008319 [Aspergillus flavus]